MQLADLGRYCIFAELRKSKTHKFGISKICSLDYLFVRCDYIHREIQLSATSIPWLHYARSVVKNHRHARAHFVTFFVVYACVVKFCDYVIERERELPEIWLNEADINYDTRSKINLDIEFYAKSTHCFIDNVYVCWFEALINLTTTALRNFEMQYAVQYEIEIRNVCVDTQQRLSSHYLSFEFDFQCGFLNG